MPTLDAASTDAPAVVASPAPGFDLSQLDSGAPPPDFHAVHKRCDYAAAKPDEIVVCAPDPDAERLGDASGFGGYAMPEGQGPSQLTWTLGGVDMDVHVESLTMPNGMTSKRVMVGAKIAF